MEILHDLKMQFVDLLLVMWIFWGQIGHKNYEDLEHPTLRGAVVTSKGASKGISIFIPISMFIPHTDSS